MKQCETIGVKFKRAGKIYDYLNNGINFSIGDKVIIESDKGEDIADVIVANRNIEIPDTQDMKSIIRKATDKDIQQNITNKNDATNALVECKKLIAKSDIDMKILACEYTLDRSKLTFFFTSEGRVDFRQLVKDLARIFKTRIEMRQIGIRDATKMIGGFGLCGREFCCTSFLRKFDNISIKMAKTQNLILNPTKISGVCGRLMCCLMFEKDQYPNCNKCNNSADEEFVEINDTMDNIIKEDK